MVPGGEGTEQQELSQDQASRPYAPALSTDTLGSLGPIGAQGTCHTPTMGSPSWQPLWGFPFAHITPIQPGTLQAFPCSRAPAVRIRT